MATAAIGAYGQGKVNSISLTPQVGVSLGKQNGFEGYQSTLPTGAGISYYPDARYKAGFTAGMEAAYQATPEWAFSVGVFYTQTGSKYKDFEAVLNETEQPAPSGQIAAQTLWQGHAFTEQHNTFGYVMIPVMAHYYLAKGFAVKAGVELGFLTSAKREWTRTDFTIDNETDTRTLVGTPVKGETDIKDEAKSTVLAIPVGLSYEYEHVVLDARYHIPLTQSMKTIDTHNRLFTITVGYRF